MMWVLALAATSAACAAPERRQLDFWLGEWVVTDTAKKYEVGSSRIERIVNGCAIKESYDAPKAPGGAYSGTSYSGFDPKDAKWHQMYVDVNGNVTWYSGGLEGAPPELTDSRDRCRFAPRCEFVRDVCREREPELTERESAEHLARCWGTEPGGWAHHG